MSVYTDSASRPGLKGGDDRALFLTEFGGLVINARDQVMDYADHRWIKHITQGKADSFPIIGDKYDATDHTPGEILLGGTVDHDEVVITLDKMLVDAVFVPEIEELMAHYSFMEPYASRLGNSIGTTMDKRIATMHILASRDTTVRPGQPAPAYYYHANLKTDPSKLEEAAFKARQYLLEVDEVGPLPKFMIPHAQYLLMARYSGIEGGPVSTGSGNRSSGTVGPVAGLTPQGTNHIPQTNVTTGLSKYQGDFSTTVGHISTRMAVGSLERRALRVTIKEQGDRLGTLMIASQFNGHGKLRCECSIELRTDADGGRAAL